MDIEYDLEVFETANGKVPFFTWESKLPQVIRNLIKSRLARLRVGNFGDVKAITGVNGLYELRLHNSPGYRIYFGRVGNKLIILLCGGTKGTQDRDIERAKLYWKDYLGSTH